MNSPNRKDPAPPLLPLRGRKAPYIYLGASRPSRPHQPPAKEGGGQGRFSLALAAGGKAAPPRASLLGGRGGNAPARLATGGRRLARASRCSRSPRAACPPPASATGARAPRRSRMRNLRHPLLLSAPRLLRGVKAVCHLALLLVLAGISLPILWKSESSGSPYLLTVSSA